MNYTSHADYPQPHMPPQPIPPAPDLQLVGPTTDPIGMPASPPPASGPVRHSERPSRAMRLVVLLLAIFAIWGGALTAWFLL